jgi:hypothetical protein
VPTIAARQRKVDDARDMVDHRRAREVAKAEGRGTADNRNQGPRA